MITMTRIQKRLLTIALAFICLLSYPGTPTQARNAFDIVSIDLTVSPNPIPCGGTATATATIQMPVNEKNPDGIITTISLWDYDTLFRDGDDELDRKSGCFDIIDDKIILTFTLHCQIKEGGCQLYGPAGNSGESGTYVFVRIEDSDTKSPRVYLQCKQTEMDAIVRLDGPDGPDNPDEPATIDDDNTILPGGSKMVTMSAEEPIIDVVSGSWKIEYDPANLVPTQVDYIHPAFAGALQHVIFPDHIAFEFDYPPGTFLDGELVRVYFDTVASPAAEWAPTYVQCGDDRSFENSGGLPIMVCMGGPLSLFIPPVDMEAPMLHPEHIHFDLREITGSAGAVTDNRSDLENYLTLALYDENNELVAVDFAAGDGSFHLGNNFFMLSPIKPSTIVVYDGTENQDSYSFIPSPDLEEAISILRILCDLPPGIPLIEDVNGDDKIGLSEGLYVLQRVSGQRTAPPLTLSISGSVSGTNDVLINIEGPHPQQIVSGPDGCYQFSGLEPGGTYILTPEKSGFTFLPPQREYNILDSILMDQNFVAVPSD